MRLLANENFPNDVVVALREAGHDVLWIVEVDRGAEDVSVLRRASDERRILLTFDKDFGALAFQQGLPAESGVILFRVTPISSEYIVHLVLVAVNTRADWEGHFSVVEEDRIRMTPLPNRGE